MRVLVTGATGYVGSRLREFLRRDGHHVRLLVRKESAGKAGAALSADPYELVLGDIFETNTCLHACESCDAVIHLVGIIREIPAQGITFDEVHRVATSNIVDAARRARVTRFIHMSALGARDDAPSEYHRTKRAAERIVEGSGLQWTIFRPSWIFSPGDAMARTIKDLVCKPVVPLIGGGSAQIQPVALDDVCRSMASALRMPETQGKTYELGGPDRLTYRELFEQAAAAAGRKIRTVTIPAGAVRPAVAVLQRFQSFPLTLDQLRMLSEDNVCEADAWAKAFGVVPQSFCEAIPRMFGQAG
jgi:NADH dehydrogenase